RDVLHCLSPLCFYFIVIHFFDRYCFFFSDYCDPRYLHSFPTRPLPICITPAELMRIGMKVFWPSRMRPRPMTLRGIWMGMRRARSEEHTSELQSRGHLVCRLLLEKKKRRRYTASPSTAGPPTT